MTAVGHTQKGLQDSPDAGRTLAVDLLGGWQTPSRPGLRVGGPGVLSGGGKDERATVLPWSDPELAGLQVSGARAACPRVSLELATQVEAPGPGP